MKKLTKEERAYLWESFAKNIGVILDDDNLSMRMHHQLLDMLDEFVPEIESASSRYRRMIPMVAADLMPRDLPPPPRDYRTEEPLTCLFNELGDDIRHILADDKTPPVIRQAFIDFIDKMDAQAREFDPERYKIYQAQMLFPLTLDIVNDRDDEEEYSAERLAKLMGSAV